MPHSQSGQTSIAKGVTLLIVGASARAAAQSASRAGFDPVCADLFADEDLRAIARVITLQDYPRGLVEAACQAPTGPWIYTGALENHPDVIRAISIQRPLWGNSPEVVSRIRNPFEVHQVLAAAGLPVPDVRRASDPPPRDGRWLLKPARSAGGHGILVWDDSAAGTSSRQQASYFQRRIEGESISALFVAAAGENSFIGASKQLIGCDWLNARDFAYCGSLGPLKLDADVAATVSRIGSVLAEAFDLRGLFGCDFQLRHGEPWLTEVNPRYTASVEIFESAWGIPLLDWHRRACSSFDEKGDHGLGLLIANAKRGQSVSQASCCVGKAILFADSDLVVPGGLLGEVQSASAELPRIADVPRSGFKISAGHPVCTLLVRGADEETCLNELRSRVLSTCRYVTTREPV